MRLLSNVYDPNLPEAKQYLALKMGETRKEARVKQKRWLEGKVVGRPKATGVYSVFELEQMNMVGVYAID